MGNVFMWSWNQATSNGGLHASPDKQLYSDVTVELTSIATATNNVIIIIGEYLSAIFAWSFQEVTILLGVSYLQIKWVLWPGCMSITPVTTQNYLHNNFHSQAMVRCLHVRKYLCVTCKLAHFLLCPPCRNM